MSSEWYVRKGESEVGPFSLAQMKHFAQSGKLSSNTMVKMGAAGNWCCANEVPDLFGRSTPVTLQNTPSEEVKVLRCHLCGEARPSATAVCPSCGSIPTKLLEAPSQSRRNFGGVAEICFGHAASEHPNEIFLRTIRQERLQKAQQAFAKNLTDGETAAVLVELVERDFLHHVGSNGFLLTDIACYHGNKEAGNRFELSNVAGFARIGASSLQVFLRHTKKGEECQQIRFRRPIAASAMEAFLIRITAVPVQFQCRKCKALVPYNYSTNVVQGACKKCTSMLYPPYRLNTFLEQATFEDFESATEALETLKHALPPMTSAYKPSGQIPATAVLSTVFGFFVAILFYLIAATVILPLAKVVSSAIAASIGRWVPGLMSLAGVVWLLAYGGLGAISGATVGKCARRANNRNPTFPGVVGGLAAGLATFAYHGADYYLFRAVGADPDLLLVLLGHCLLGGAVAVCSACYFGYEGLGADKYCEDCQVYMTSSQLFDIPKHAAPNFAWAMRQCLVPRAVSIYRTAHLDSKDSSNVLSSCPACGMGYAEFFIRFNITYLADTKPHQHGQAWCFGSVQLTAKGVEAMKDATPACVSAGARTAEEGS